MRDGWGPVAFAVGLGTFCALGFALGHHLPGVGTAVTIGAMLPVLLFALAALRQEAR